MDTEEARIFTVVLIIVSGLVIIISAFFTSVYRQQRRMQNLQKALALAELNAMESERERIAADLHDGMAPQLSVVKFQIDSVEVAEEEDKLQLRSASETIDELLTHLRELSTNLMPAALLNKGLLPALTEYIRKIQETSETEIEFDVGRGVVLPSQFNTNVFRMMQEIIYNSCRHAKAIHLLVRLQRQGDHLEILIRDDGVGFNVEQTMEETKGIGLRNIKNRAAAMNSDLIIESEVNKGTAFKFSLPAKIN